LAAQDTIHVAVAGRDVAFWKPAGRAPAEGYPVVLFSHGFTGCNTQSVFLMKALANAGYLVLAPNHKDARCGTARGQAHAGNTGYFLTTHPEAPFANAARWSDTTYRERAADLKAVLDAVENSRSFQGTSADLHRIGLAGHSLGGYTVLGLAGAWPSWKDNRVKAVLALSPYCAPYVDHGDLGHIGAPLMYQGGTLDLGISPSVHRLGGCYDRSSSPKYYVEFTGAGHFAWTDLNPRFQSLISSYSVAFFDDYLKGDGSPNRLTPLIGTPPPRGVATIKVAPAQ